MALNIECESRIMLSKEEYKTLLAFYKGKSKTHYIRQVNHYIDSTTFDLRNANRKSLRIRDINGNKSELTLKLKGFDGDKEYNEYISKETKDSFFNKGIFPEGEIKNILSNSKIDISKLKVLTSLSTIRYEKKIDDYLIVIDKNEYNGIVDYNMEIEAPSMKRAYEVMNECCQKFGLTFKEKYDTKSKRALQSILRK